MGSRYVEARSRIVGVGNGRWKLQLVMCTAWRGVHFFWRLLPARHLETGIRTNCALHPPPKPFKVFCTPMGCGLQPARDKAQLWWFSPSPCHPPSPVKTYCISFSRSQCRTNIDHFKKQNPRIIHRLQPNRDSLSTLMLRLYPRLPLHILPNIYSHAFVSVLSDSVSNFVPTAVLCRCH